MSAAPIKVASVCRVLPTPANPAQGVFVHNRLDGMAGYMDVQRVQPVPFFPLLRPLPAWVDEAADVLRVPMFYLPGIFKEYDGRWMERAIFPVLARLQEERGLDVIDAHFGYPEAVACVNVARRLGVKVLVTIRGLEEDYVRHAKIAPQLIQSVTAADGVICVSQSLAKLMSSVGVPPARIHVVHNAIDRTRFFPGSRAAARSELKLSESTPMVFSAARIVPGKRHTQLIEAFARLRQHHSDARLFIAGATDDDPGYTDTTRKLIQTLNLDASVTLLGSLDPTSIARYYQAADVFGLMTAREGCCNAVLEALACGLATVTTDAGDNAVFVKNGVNGQIVAVDDVEGCATAMARFIDSPLDRDGISRSLELGTWSEIGATLTGVFQQALAP